MSTRNSSDQSAGYNDTVGYGSATMGEFPECRAGQLLGFFLPHLNQGVSLLDCACGPGGITVDLAQEVSCSRTSGVVYLDEGSLDVARELANKQGVSNVSVQTRQRL